MAQPVLSLVRGAERLAAGPTARSPADRPCLNLGLVVSLGAYWPRRRLTM